jgi:hypothetical protein
MPFTNVPWRFLILRFDGVCLAPDSEIKMDRECGAASNEMPRKRALLGYVPYRAAVFFVLEYPIAGH